MEFASRANALEQRKSSMAAWLAGQPIKSGFETKGHPPGSVETAVIDSTVQEKKHRYPNDAKLYYKGILLLG